MRYSPSFGGGIGTRSIPQSGHFPAVADRTSGCIGHQKASGRSFSRTISTRTPPPASNSADSDVRFTGVTPIRRDRGFVIAGHEAKMVIAAGVRLNDPCRGPRSRCCRNTPGRAATPQPIRTHAPRLAAQVRWVTLVEPVEQHEFIVCPDADAQPGDDDTRASQLRRGLVHRRRRIADAVVHVMKAHGLRLIGDSERPRNTRRQPTETGSSLPVIIAPRLVTIRML